jgi:hypothetical protein
MWEQWFSPKRQYITTRLHPFYIPEDCSPPLDAQQLQVEVTIPEASERTTAEE